MSNILPYAHTFHPTIHDAVTIRWVLREKLHLPLELAIRIVSLGYGPYTAKSKAQNRDYRTYQAHGDRYSVAGLYLSTLPIPFGTRSIIPQRIIFQTRAADQGWATFGGNDSFQNSHTWFEASILRPCPTTMERIGGNAPLERAFADGDPWWEPQLARNALKERGWDFVEGQGGQLTWKVCNNITAESRPRNYMVEWRRGIETEVEDELALGKGDGFLELLVPGCIVVLWARADQRFWVNRVKAATIEIEYRLP